MCVCVCVCVCVCLRPLFGFDSQGIVGILWGLFVNINSSKFYFYCSFILRHYSQMAAKAPPHILLSLASHTCLCSQTQTNNAACGTDALRKEQRGRILHTLSLFFISPKCRFLKDQFDLFKSVAGAFFFSSFSPAL